MEVAYMGPGNALLVFGICGIVGVLVDLDHVISYYLVPQWSGRFLHTPLLVVSSAVLCGLITYIGGLFIRMVLKKGLSSTGKGGGKKCLKA